MFVCVYIYIYIYIYSEPFHFPVLDDDLLVSSSFKSATCTRFADRTAKLNNNTNNTNTNNTNNINTGNL